MKRFILLFLSLCMLVLSVPAVSYAEQDADTLVITTDADTFIEQAKGGANASVNFSTETFVRYQNQSSYDREAWFRFNLAQLKSKKDEGREIKSVKLRLYISSFYNKNTGLNGNVSSNKVGAVADLYALNSENYDPTTITWATEGRPQRTGEPLASVKLNAGVTDPTDTKTLEEGPYEFDLTDYFRNKTQFSDYETFVMFPKDSLISGNVISLEDSGNPTKAATLIVTYKRELKGDFNLNPPEMKNSAGETVDNLVTGDITLNLTVSNTTDKDYSATAFAVLYKGGECAGVMLAEQKEAEAGQNADLSIPIAVGNDITSVKVFGAKVLDSGMFPAAVSVYTLSR